GMAAQAVQYLDAAGIINVLSRQLWDSSPWLPQDGIIGRMLHTLIGYTDRPTELQLIAYLATLTAMAALTWLAAPAPARRAPAEFRRRAPSTARGTGRRQGCGFAALRTAKATSGASSITLSSARAGPRGERLPCSQLRTVSIGTPMRAANCAWVSLVRARTPRA